MAITVVFEYRFRFADEPDDRAKPHRMVVSGDAFDPETYHGEPHGVSHMVGVVGPLGDTEWRFDNAYGVPNALFRHLGLMLYRLQRLPGTNLVEGLGLNAAAAVGRALDTLDVAPPRPMANFIQRPDGDVLHVDLGVIVEPRPQG